MADQADFAQQAMEYAPQLYSAAMRMTRNRADAASADLRRLVGLSPGTLIEIDVSLTPAIPPAEPDPALVEEARAARPDRDVLGRRIDAAAAARAAAGAGTRPQLSVGGGVDYNRPNSRHLPLREEWRTSWDLGVTLSWPLWDAACPSGTGASTLSC